MWPRTNGIPAERIESCVIGIPDASRTMAWDTGRSAERFSRLDEGLGVAATGPILAAMGQRIFTVAGVCQEIVLQQDTRREGA